MRTDTQTVYIARGRVSGLLKIGRTVDLKLRLRAIATQHQEPVEALAAMTACGLYENALLRKFATSLYPGRGREWFYDDGAIRAFVEELPDHHRSALSATPGVLGSKPRLAATIAANRAWLAREQARNTARRAA